MMNFVMPFRLMLSPIASLSGLDGSRTSSIPPFAKNYFARAFYLSVPKSMNVLRGRVVPLLILLGRSFLAFLPLVKI